MHCIVVETNWERSNNYGGQKSTWIQFLRAIVIRFEQFGYWVKALSMFLGIMAVYSSCGDHGQLASVEYILFNVTKQDLGKLTKPVLGFNTPLQTKHQQKL